MESEGFISAFALSMPHHYPGPIAAQALPIFNPSDLKPISTLAIR
jgi:hypothetical protein